MPQYCGWQCRAGSCWAEACAASLHVQRAADVHCGQLADEVLENVGQRHTLHVLACKAEGGGRAGERFASRDKAWCSWMVPGAGRYNTQHTCTSAVAARRRRTPPVQTPLVAAHALDSQSRQVGVPRPPFSPLVARTPVTSAAAGRTRGVGWREGGGMQHTEPTCRLPASHTPPPPPSPSPCRLPALHNPPPPPPNPSPPTHPRPPGARSLWRRAGRSLRRRP